MNAECIQTAKLRQTQHRMEAFAACLMDGKASEDGRIRPFLHAETAPGLHERCREAPVTLFATGSAGFSGGPAAAYHSQEPRSGEGEQSAEGSGTD